MMTAGATHANATQIIVGQQTAMIKGDQEFSGRNVAVGDFNHDGFDDVVVSTLDGWFYIYGRDQVESNNTIDGLMIMDAVNISIDDDPTDILKFKTIDYNLDGIDDLLIASQIDHKIYGLYGKIDGWMNAMNNSDFDFVIDGFSSQDQGLFALDYEVGDIDSDGKVDLLVYRTTRDAKPSVAVYKNVADRNVLDYSIISNGGEEDSFGVRMELGDFLGDHNLDLAVTDLNNVYIYDVSTFSGNIGHAVGASTIIKLDQEDFVTAMTSVKNKDKSKESLFIGVPNRSLVYGFQGDENWAGDVLLSAANTTLSSNSNSTLLGYDLTSDDVDQDGFEDLSVSALSSNSGNINDVASGAVYLFAHDQIFNGNLNVDFKVEDQHLALFTGESFNLWGTPHLYGDFDNDKIKDVLGGGSSAYAAVSTGLNPFPIVDIQGSILSGRSIFKTGVSANANFGTLQWFLNGHPISGATSDNIDLSLTKGEYKVTVQASRNGFATMSSPIDLISTNNPPHVEITPSEYTVNTGDLVSVNLLKADKDGDAINTLFKFVNDNLTLANDQDFSYKTHTRGKDIFSANVNDSEDLTSTSINVSVLNNPPIAKIKFDNNKDSIEKEDFLNSEEVHATINIFDYENDDLNVKAYLDGNEIALTAKAGNVFTTGNINAGLGLHELKVHTVDSWGGQETMNKFFMNNELVVAKNHPSGNLNLMTAYATPGSSVQVVLNASHPTDSNLTLDILGSQFSKTSEVSGSNLIGNITTASTDRGLKSVVGTISDSNGAVLSPERKIVMLSNPPIADVFMVNSPVLLGNDAEIYVQIKDKDITDTNFTISATSGTNVLVFSNANTGANDIYKAAFTPTNIGATDVTLKLNDGYDISNANATVHVANLNAVPSINLFASDTIFNSGDITGSIVVNDLDSQANITTTLKIDGVDVPLTGSASSASFNINSPSVGTHVLEVNATDGTETAKVKKTVHVVTETFLTDFPPFVNLNINQSAAFIGDKVQISWEAFDEKIISKSLSIAGQNIDISNISSYEYVPTTTGDVEVVLTVNDGVYTSSMTKNMIVRSALNKPPEAKVSLLDTMLYKNGTINGTLYTSDADGDNVSVSVSHSGNAINLSSSGNKWTWSHNLVNPSNVLQTYSYDIEISDGNYTSKLTSQVYVYPEYLPDPGPVINASYPYESLVNGGNVNLNFSANDDQALSSLNVSRDPYSKTYSSGNIISEVLNIGISKKGSTKISLVASDVNGSTTLQLPLKSYNQLPNQFIELEDQSITVTESMNASAEVYDPDSNDSPSVSISANHSNGSTLQQNAGMNAISAISSTIAGNGFAHATIADSEQSLNLFRSYEITPIFKNFAPQPNLLLSDLTIEEGKSATFTLIIDDADKTDVHTLSSILNDVNVNMTKKEDRLYEYTINNASVGKHTLSVIVNDGTDSATVSMTLVVIPLNYPPTIKLSVSDPEVRIKQPIYLSINGDDQDEEDTLDYKIFVDGIEGALSGTEDGVREFIYTPLAAGNVVFEATVFDGQDTTKAIQVVDVVENQPPVVDLVVSPTIPRVGIPTRFTLSITDPNIKEDLEGEITINGTTIVLAQQDIIQQSYTFDVPGTYSVVGVGSDGDKTATKNIVLEVLPQITDNGSAIDLGGDGLSSTAISLLQNVGSTTTVEQGNDVITRLTNVLSGQDLTNAFHTMSSMVLSGNAEEKTIADPNKDVFVDIISVTSSTQTISTTPQERNFSASLDNVPVGNKIVFGTLPINMDPNTPIDATGKLMSIDMYSGATKVEDGFNIKMTVKKVYNPNEEQFLYHQDPKTGKFSQAQVAPNVVGDDLQFNLRHFSVYVLGSRAKTNTSTTPTTTNGVGRGGDLGAFGGTGPEANSGGGCLLK